MLSWQDGGKQLQEGMDENSVITIMDLRLTECGQEAEYCINKILNRNREQERERRLAENAQTKKHGSAIKAPGLPQA